MYIVPPGGEHCSLEVAKIQALSHHAFFREVSDLFLSFEDVVRHLGNAHTGNIETFTTGKTDGFMPIPVTTLMP